MNQLDYQAGLRAIDLNPVNYAIAAEDFITSRACAGIPPETAERLAAPLRAQLFEHASVSLKQYKFTSIDDHLTAYRRALDAAVFKEKTEGSLKPYNVDDEYKCLDHLFAPDRWNGTEIGGAKQLTPPGVKPLGVTPRQIETSAEPITRRAVHEFLLSRRPRYGDIISDAEYIATVLTPEHVVAEIEKERAADAYKRAHPVYQSGPPSIIGKPVRAPQGE